MTPRTGLAGAVVQRSLADWPVVLAALLLLICATTLLATGVVYGDAVAGGGLHRALLDEPPRPADRSSCPCSADPAHLSDARRRRPARARADAMATTGGDVLRAVRTGSFANAATPADQVTDLTILESLDGIENQATLVDGAWPQAGGTPLQATTSDAAAAALGVHVGDRLSLVSRQDPARRVDAVISGIWRADPTAAWSRGDPLETTGSTTGGDLHDPRPDRDPRGGSRWAWPARPRRRRVARPAGSSAPSASTASTRCEPASTSLQPRLGQRPAGRSAARGSRRPCPTLLDEVGRSVLVSRSGVDPR